MNDKLNIQNLIDLFVQKQGVPPKEAEEFIKAFFSLIEEGLEQDRYVKIKKWGTFKLIDVDSRESIDVNTGERIEIQGHSKVSFTPDSSLKEIINRPFAHFETVILNENTVLEDTPLEEEYEGNSGTDGIREGESPAEKAEEKKKEDLLSPVSEPERVESADIQQETQNETEEENRPAEEENAPMETEEAAKPEETEDGSKEEAEIQARADEELDDSASEEPFPVPGDNRMKYFITLTVLIITICGAAIFFIYNPDFFARPLPPPEDPKHMVDSSALSMTPVDSLLLNSDLLQADTLLRADTVLRETPEATSVLPDTLGQVEEEKTLVKRQTEKPKQTAAQASKAFTTDSTSYEITGTETRHTIADGETLTRVALKYYGTKALWPYLVKHNPDVIKNPDNVPSGTVIKIPRLRKKK